MTHLLLLAALATPASAHIHLVEPTVRTPSQKDGPCGAEGSVRGGDVTVFAPGERITVEFDETIDHPGWYRIALDVDGQDFADPASFGDQSAPEGVELLAVIDDVGDRRYAVEVTLPQVTCERCTLQVVQVMTDKKPYGDGNDLYYQCADLAIRGEVADTDTDTDTDDTDDTRGGCAVAGTTTATPSLLLAISALARRRRRTPARAS